MSVNNPFCRRSIALLSFAGVALVPAVAAAQVAPTNAIAAPAAAVVPPAQPATVAPSTSPAAAPQPPQADQSASSNKPRASTWPAPGAFVGVLKTGILLRGSGQYASDCSSNAGLCTDNSKADYDDGARFGFGGDALFQTTRKLRLGLGTLVVTDPTYQISGVQTLHSGTELTAQGVIEALFPTSARFAFTLRAQVGALLLFPGRDHSDLIHSEQNSCESSGFPTCNVGIGPFYGPTGGFGVGTDLRVGDVGLRFDLLSQFYSMKINDVKAAVGSQRVEFSDSVSGKRLWLSAGVGL